MITIWQIEDPNIKNSENASLVKYCNSWDVIPVITFFHIFSSSSTPAIPYDFYSSLNSLRCSNFNPVLKDLERARFPFICSNDASILFFREEGRQEENLPRSRKYGILVLDHTKKMSARFEDQFRGKRIYSRIVQPSWT